jgi:hypothetical protein
MNEWRPGDDWAKIPLDPKYITGAYIVGGSKTYWMPRVGDEYGEPVEVDGFTVHIDGSTGKVRIIDKKG